MPAARTGEDRSPGNRHPILTTTLRLKAAARVSVAMPMPTPDTAVPAVPDAND